MKHFRILFAMLAFVSIFNSCKKDDPALPDNLVNFGATEQGLGADETTATVKLSLSRISTTDVPVSLQLIAAGVTYGTEFTTTPAASGNVLALTIPAGSTEVSFTINKASGIFLQGTESVAFGIQAVTAPALKGATDTFTLKFSSIVSVGSQLTLEGKTTVSAYANGVYADLSNNMQTPVDRKSWNLGFGSGADFKVILNAAYQTTAQALTKTDITTVTIEDTTGVHLNHDISDPATAALVDYWDGDLTKTVFATVSENDADNKVYLVSFEGSKEAAQYFKVKVSRNGEGYKVQYARVGETTIKTLDVPKNADYNFSFASLENDNVVMAEPKQANWDIQWSYSTYNSGLGSPYWFQDFILLNYEGGAQAAEILESIVTYDAFAESNVAAVTFLQTRDVIGSKWRATSGATLGIKRDRFYVVKDPQGNVYKLTFVSMGVGTDGGERGRPVLKYALVKKA